MKPYWRITVSIVLALLLIGLIIGKWDWISENETNATLTAGALTALVVFVGLLFAYEQLKHMTKDRHTQALLALSQYWSSHEMQEARATLGKATLGVQEESWPETIANAIDGAREGDPELAIKLVTVADFFEDIGLLVAKQFLQPSELVLQVYAMPVKWYWELYKEWIERAKEKWQREDIYEWFAYLYKESTGYAQKKPKGPKKQSPRAA